MRKLGEVAADMVDLEKETYNFLELVLRKSTFQNSRSSFNHTQILRKRIFKNIKFHTCQNATAYDRQHAIYPLFFFVLFFGGGGYRLNFEIQ